MERSKNVKGGSVMITVDAKCHGHNWHMLKNGWCWHLTVQAVTLYCG